MATSYRSGVTQRDCGLFRRLPCGNTLLLMALLAPLPGYAEQPDTAQPEPHQEAAAPTAAEAAVHGEGAAAHAHLPDEHGAARHHRFHLGILGAAHAALVAGGVFSSPGGGLLFAWIAVPSRLELETVLSTGATEGGVEFTQALLVKVPFHLTRRIHPFVELGPTVAEYLVSPETPGAPGRTGWGLGGGVGAGADVWLTRDVALIGVLDYGLLYRQLSAGAVTSGGVSHELGGGLGVLVGL